MPLQPSPDISNSTADAHMPNQPKNGQPLKAHPPLSESFTHNTKQLPGLDGSGIGYRDTNGIINTEYYRNRSNDWDKLYGIHRLDVDFLQANYRAYKDLMYRALIDSQDPVLRPFPTQEKPMTMVQRGTRALLHTYISPYLMRSFIQERSQDGYPIRMDDFFKELAKGASIRTVELSLASIIRETHSTAIADTVARSLYYVPEDNNELSQRPDVLAVKSFLALQIPPDILQRVFQKLEHIDRPLRLGDILHEVHGIHKPFTEDLVEKLTAAGPIGKEMGDFLLGVLEKGFDREKIKIARPSVWKRLTDSIKHVVLMRRLGVSFKQQREMRKSLKQFGNLPIFNAPTIYAPQRYKQAAAEFYRKYPQGSKVPQYGTLALTPEQEAYLDALTKQGKANIPALRKSLGEMNYNWLIAQEVFGGKPHKAEEGEYFN